MNNKQQRGFTLIELVMVIVLLGILAVTALPRFADLSGSANESVFEAVRSNFKTGVNLVHSISLIHRDSSGYPDVSLEGQCIIVNSTSGYPEVDQSGACTPVALNDLFLNDHFLNSPLFASPIRYQPLPPPWVERALASINDPSWLVPAAYAVPPPPPPPPVSSTELPGLLMDSDFTDWVWTKTPPIAVLESPEGLSFSYNQNNGAVN